MKHLHEGDLVRAICAQAGIACQEFHPLSGGQVNRVYLVDGAYVVRIGLRQDAFERLRHETELMRSLVDQAPVPRIYAFGQMEGCVYQVQQFIAGQKLYAVWKDLQPDAQDNIVAELAGYLKTLHSRPAAYFGDGRSDASQRFTNWLDVLEDKFKRTLAEICVLNIRMVPGFLELAADFFEEHKRVLREGTPVLIHGDLSLVNILANDGKISALLDFEYSSYAPRDYELWVIEAFCLYPNDWAEEDNEVFCTADFGNFVPLLRKYYPALFETPYLRERIDLYHLDATLGSYLAWRKDNLSTIPPEKMAGKDFYMARIANFTFSHGARLFF